MARAHWSRGQGRPEEPCGSPGKLGLSRLETGTREGSSSGPGNVTVNGPPGQGRKTQERAGAPIEVAAVRGPHNGRKT